jgi:hypothetical protein
MNVLPTRMTTLAIAVATAIVTVIMIGLIGLIVIR